MPNSVKKMTLGGFCYQCNKDVIYEITNVFVHPSGTGGKMLGTPSETKIILSLNCKRCSNPKKVTTTWGSWINFITQKGPLKTI